MRVDNLQDDLFDMRAIPSGDLQSRSHIGSQHLCGVGSSTLLNAMVRIRLGPTRGETRLIMDT